MRARLFMAAGLSLIALRSVDAQCTGTPTSATQATEGARQQAQDVFQYMAPQLGLALAGGNATLGQGSTLGGLGHFSVGVRVNAVRGSLPEMVTPSAFGAQSTAYETKDQIIGLPTADLAIGLFKGIP